MNQGPLRRRRLGRTEIEVSELAFGCGPVADLMTSSARQRQADVLQHAMDRGLNWIDTAAGYGSGSSEQAVGHALRELERADQVHIATKVRLTAQELSDIEEAIRRSLDASLRRLQRSRVTLLQLHNPITWQRDDLATSIGVDDVLGPGGVLDAFRQLQHEGLVGYLGITAVGHPDPLRQVIGSGQFDTIQTPYHLLNPSAGQAVTALNGDADYGNVIHAAAQQDMGVFVIRVLAAGALMDHEPSRHTQTSRFFPLDQYQRDRRRAIELQAAVGPQHAIRDIALRFALQHPHVSSAIVGMSTIDHVDQAIASAAKGPLTDRVLDQLQRFLDTARDI